MAETDLWTIEAEQGCSGFVAMAGSGGRCAACDEMWEHPNHAAEHATPEANLRAWWAKKDTALRQVTSERRATGCTCEAPPWFSPPGEWPMRILLTHDDDCGTPLGTEGDPLARIAARHRHQPIGHLDELGFHPAHSLGGGEPCQVDSGPTPGTTP